MISSEALKSWFADPARQEGARQWMDDFAIRMARNPLIIDLKHRLDALPDKTAATVAEAAAAFLARTDEIAELIEGMIVAAATDPFFRPPVAQMRSDISSGLLLFDDPSVAIGVAVMRAEDIAAKKEGAHGPASITFTGLHTLYKFIEAGGATLSFWEAPPAGLGFVADERLRCRCLGARTIKDGELIAIDGRSQSFVIEHAASSIVHVQAAIRAGAAPLAVEYDSRTLALVGASSTDEAASRIQMMVSLLRIMDRADAVPLIARFLEGTHFYTRWHIMRELLALDAEAALPSLRRMAEEDPHPELRAAAGQVLAAFFTPAEDQVPCPA